VLALAPGVVVCATFAVEVIFAVEAGSGSKAI
jgi:hypothetical protein